MGENYNTMADIATADVILMELLIYCAMSLILISLMNMYAVRKLGGKDALGYKVLRLSRFISLSMVGVYTLVLSYWTRFGGLEVSRQTLIFLGLPYFIIWSFYLMNILRRVRAETKGKAWLQNKK